MDILNTRVLNIEGRLYIDYSQEKLEGDDVSDYRANEPFQKDFTPTQEEPQSNKFKEVLPCPSALLKYVIGRQGQTIKRLRYETGSRIDIPKGGKASSIIVTANNQNDGEAAITRIRLLLAEKRWNEPFQHFVSIPLTDQVIKDGFIDFKERVLASHGEDRGVCEKLFQDEHKIHLTIGTLVILDDSESEKAKQTLKNIQESDMMSQVRGATISVHGIEYMNDDPAMVDVLYAKVSCPQAPGLLQRLADHIVSEFIDSGLMKKEHEHVKLHATVMNSIRTMEKKPARKKGGKADLKRDTFDATNILSNFQDYDFGQMLLNQIHISKRFSTDKSGYYDSLHIAKIQ